MQQVQHDAISKAKVGIGVGSLAATATAVAGDCSRAPRRHPAGVSRSPLSIARPLFGSAEAHQQSAQIINPGHELKFVFERRLAAKVQKGPAITVYKDSGFTMLTDVRSSSSSA